MEDQMQEPVRIEVDFRQVGADCRVQVDAPGMTEGAPVEAYDPAGNRCRAVVVAVEGSTVQLDLVLDSFRSSAE